jgi:hypothetical protein
LIVRIARGEDVAGRAEAFNTVYLRLFDAFLRLYNGQYPLMGNAQVMTAKASWDNACYWGITGLIYFQRRYRRPEFMLSVEPLMRRFFVLHARMQQFFHAWDLADTNQYEDAYANVVAVEYLRNLQTSLLDPPMDDGALVAKLDQNFALLESLSKAWQALATERSGLARFVPEATGRFVDISPLRLTPVRTAAVHAGFKRPS